MAHFRGTVQGRRGMASRLGDKSTGLHVTAASWQGAVSVQLYSRDGVDYARVSLTQHNGAGVNLLLFDYPVSGANALNNLNAPKISRGRVKGTKAASDGAAHGALVTIVEG